MCGLLGDVMELASRQVLQSKLCDEAVGWMEMRRDKTSAKQAIICQKERRIYAGEKAANVRTVRMKSNLWLLQRMRPDGEMEIQWNLEP